MSNSSTRIIFTPLVLCVLFATPFLWSGQWYTAVVIVSGVLLWQCWTQANRIDDREKWKIRFNVMEAPDVVQAMADCETNNNQQSSKDVVVEEQQRREARIILATGLAALAKKYNAIRIPRVEKEGKSKKPQRNPQTDSLALLCQEAAYIGFRCYLDGLTPSMDVSSASIALLALIAKNEAVRERHRYEADVYGLNIPAEVIRKCLELAKEIHDDKQQEQEAAEVQRKSCLLLGALAEGDADLAQLVAGEGGIDIVMKAAQWYRYHADVLNWALWALFILCFEYPPNKATFVENEGIALAIEAMRNCPESTEVARHGVALVFDLMRENPETRLDVWRIRKAALAAGLHDVLVKAMQEHADAMDIMMMGSEILVGTGYAGEIPTYDPPELNSIER